VQQTAEKQFQQQLRVINKPLGISTADKTSKEIKPRINNLKMHRHYSKIANVNLLIQQ